MNLLKLLSLLNLFMVGTALLADSQGQAVLVSATTTGNGPGSQTVLPSPKDPQVPQPTREGNPGLQLPPSVIAAPPERSVPTSSDF